MSIKVARHELKYYIPYSDYIINRQILKKLMKQDPHQKSDDGYFIRSLYFDDLYNQSVEEKLAGVEHRDKLRLRIYDTEQDWVKLERKRKHNDYVNKSTVIITKDQAQKLIIGDADWLLGVGSRTSRSIYLDFKTRFMRPVAIVDYDREVYMMDYNEIRITFDKRLRANVTDLDLFSDKVTTVPLVPDEVIIMEVKFNGFLPPWFSDLLRLNNGARSAVSKYAQSRMMEGDFT